MEYVASNGLRVHILDPRLFRIMHVMEQIPWFERHDSLVSHLFFNSPFPICSCRLSRCVADVRVCWKQIHHTTCADDRLIKLFVAKAEVSFCQKLKYHFSSRTDLNLDLCVQGYWGDVDQYYTQPPSLISIESLSATENEATQLFKLLLALG